MTYDHNENLVGGIERVCTCSAERRAVATGESHL